MVQVEVVIQPPIIAISPGEWTELAAVVGRYVTDESIRGLHLLFTICTMDFGITPWHLAATIIGRLVTESHNVSKSVLLKVRHD